MALGFSEAGPSNPGLEAHSGMGSETTIILLPSPETVHCWMKCTVQFTSAIPTQIQPVAESQAPLVSLQPYYFDVEDCSVKPASLDLSPAQVAIDDQCLELLKPNLPLIYHREFFFSLYIPFPLIPHCLPTNE